MENHHFYWENSLYMAMFNSYVKLPEGKSSFGIGKTSNWWFFRSVFAGWIPRRVSLEPSLSCFHRLSWLAQSASLLFKDVILAHKAWTFACTKPLSLVLQAPLFCNRSPIFAMWNMLLWHVSLFNQLSNFAICFRKHSINNTFQSGVNTREVT